MKTTDFALPRRGRAGRLCFEPGQIRQAHAEQANAAHLEQFATTNAADDHRVAAESMHGESRQWN